MSTIKEAKELFDLGFAIHWLKPKSKAPVKPKWTTGPRAKWDDLKNEYKPGFNLGVRLGTPSCIDGKYLAVIDVDVKSTDPKHQAEALKAVKDLFPKLAGDSIQVLSGRGNGSSHFYVLTPNPATPARRRVSSEEVKVLMPSAGINAKQKSLLSEEDLNEGWRIRPAWEVAVMGEGQQVVLPPSIHPDSGQPYKWVNRAPWGVGDFCQLELGSKQKDLIRESTNDWTPELVDLVTSELSNETIHLIETNDGEDGSANLFKVCIEMVRLGWSDREIMSVLTDQQYALGCVAFNHAKTQSRTRAANWVFNYNIKKARKDYDAQLQFDGEVSVLPELTPEAAAKQAQGLHAPLDWRNLLERRGGNGADAAKPKNTLENVILILKNEVSDDVFRRNEFAGQDVYGRNTPWGGQEGREVQDVDIIRIKTFVARRYRFEPSNDRIGEAIIKIADENKFHPVQNYLNALPAWDGEERLKNWMVHALGAQGPIDYVEAVSRKVIVAMIARAYHPGAKFDQVLILEGRQGAGKSTVVRNLASPEWFTDAHINIADKDGVLSMRAVWVVELGELSGMRKADVDQLKEFISRTSDRVRVPYGKRPENFPRQCIFIGTTNSCEYLKDATGNRRFWPVSVGDCDFEWVTNNRDQLFAEAKLYWDLGEPLYLEDQAVAALAAQEQGQRTFVDTMTEKLQKFFVTPSETFPENFTTLDLFLIGPLIDVRDDKANQMRAAEALRILGFTKRRDSSAGRFYRWYRPNLGPT